MKELGKKDKKMVKKFLLYYKNIKNNLSSIKYRMINLNKNIILID
jgi:hypothetical protein